MRYFTLILYILLIVVLGIATFVESAKGSSFVMEHIYHSVPFMVLWGALGVLMIIGVCKIRITKKSIAGSLSTRQLVNSSTFSPLWKKTFFQVGPKILLHFSFLLILAGALTTFLTSKKGMMHLRMGEPTFQYVEEGTQRVLNLPFSLELDTFYIDYYPGTEAPADYVSRVEIDGPHPQPSPGGRSRYLHNDEQHISLPSLGRGKWEGLFFSISMNNILTHKGYRFYQSSFDEDRRGSWLSVNYDPWGTGITYAGYLLCIIAMIGLMVHPRGGFRRLLQATSSLGHKNIRTKENRGGLEKFLCPFVLLSKKRRYLSLVALVALSLFLVDRLSRDSAAWPLSTDKLVNSSTQSSFAHGTKKLPIIPLEEAEDKVEMQVIYNDRVMPLNTLARDFVRKLYGKDSFSGLTPEQILLSWQRYPEEWAYVPAIKIKSDELRARLGVEGKYARMIDLFEYDKQTTCKLTWIMRELSSSTNNKPSPLQKAVVETDEKVALVEMLQNGTLIRPLPADGSVEPLSRARIEAELLYNRIPFTKILFMFNLTMGILLLAFRTLPHTPSQGRDVKCPLYQSIYSFPLGKVGMGVALLFHLTGYLLRWYIGGRIPLSNGPETMLLLALCIMAFAWVMRRRFAMALPFGFLLSGFALLVAYLGEMNPQITPLMPVLVSPWLSLHVSVIMMSYALFAFIMMGGVWALCVPREAERLEVYSRLMLYPAVFLMLAGIFIGAVWANVSWGRYWGWDPKEVWALISVMIYALPMHELSSSLGRGAKGFHIYMVVAFLSILITYFGVNFFLGGMHSYA